jgi:lactate dehydrogenase-like 2-hydroxyacid dehydrogenase
MNLAYHDILRLPTQESSLRALPSIDGHPVSVTWHPTLSTLLSTSDCILLATPFSGSTLLSTPEFSLMKRGTRLVNIARGKLIDENALVAALDSGVVSAAGLDVHANEPRVNEQLATRDNVMVLSHTAGASVESHIGFERLGMQNLMQFLGGGEAVTPVNLQWLRMEGGEGREGEGKGDEEVEQM